MQMNKEGGRWAEEKWRVTAVNVLGCHTPMDVVKEQNGVNSHFCSYGTPLYSCNTSYTIILQRSQKSAIIFISFTSIRKICQGSLRFFLYILWQLRAWSLIPEVHSLLSCPQGKGRGCKQEEVCSCSGKKVKKIDTFGVCPKKRLLKMPWKSF